MPVGGAVHRITSGHSALPLSLKLERRVADPEVPPKKSDAEKIGISVRRIIQCKLTVSYICTSGSSALTDPFSFLFCTCNRLLLSKILAVCFQITELGQKITFRNGTLPDRRGRTGLSLYFFVIFIGLLIGSAYTEAAPITTPIDLVNGQQYRLAFVTSMRRDGSSSNIADYNAFVTAAANTQSALTALGTTWTAIASTSSVSARDNTNTNGTGVPIYLLDGSTRIADNYLDLWDNSIDMPLDIQEDGTAAPGLSGTLFTESVFTGSFPNGLAFTGNELGQDVIRTGTTFSVDSSWIAGSAFLSFDELRFFALSDVLTISDTGGEGEVTVDEPASAALLALAVFGIVLRQRRGAYPL